MAQRQTRLDYLKLIDSMCLMVESELSLLQIVEESTRSQNGEHRSDLDERRSAARMSWMSKIVKSSMMSSLRFAFTSGFSSASNRTDGPA